MKFSHDFSGSRQKKRKKGKTPRRRHHQRDHMFFFFFSFPGFIFIDFVCEGILLYAASRVLAALRTNEKTFLGWRMAAAKCAGAHYIIIKWAQKGIEEVATKVELFASRRGLYNSHDDDRKPFPFISSNIKRGLHEVLSLSDNPTILSLFVVCHILIRRLQRRNNTLDK